MALVYCMNCDSTIMRSTFKGDKHCDEDFKAVSIQLKEMGVTENAHVVKAAKICKGNINLALDLLSGPLLIGQVEETRWKPL